MPCIFLGMFCVWFFCRECLEFVFFRLVSNTIFITFTFYECTCIMMYFCIHFLCFFWIFDDLFFLFWIIFHKSVWEIFFGMWYAHERKRKKKNKKHEKSWSINMEYFAFDSKQKSSMLKSLNLTKKIYINYTIIC